VGLYGAALPATRHTGCRRVLGGPGGFVSGVEAVVDGEQGQFEAIGDTELLEDVVEVVLDGLLADEELFGHLFIAIALGHELDDLALAVAERGSLADLSAGITQAISGIGKLLHHSGGSAGIEPDFAFVDLADTIGDQLHGSLFEEDARAAELHGLDKFVAVAGERKQDGAGLGSIQLQILKDGESVHAWHAQFEEENVGVKLLDHLKDLAAVGRFADDLDVYLISQQFFHSEANNGLVIGEQDPDLYLILLAGDFLYVW
jgi:hypothetical protein